MAGILIPLRRAWVRQPPASARLDTRHVKFIGAYSGQHGAVNLATGQALTRGTALSVSAQPPGLALKQTVVNAGAWCPVKNIASVNAKYVALWHGVFVGAVVGSSPKLVGVSNSATSQTVDLIGIERTSNDTVTVSVKLLNTNASRPFSVGSSAWYGKTVTLIGFYEISTMLVWLYVNVGGVVSKYSSSLSFYSDPAPTVLGTEQFCVGTDVLENATRSPNVHTALAACFFGSVHNQWLDDRLRNPWQIFAPSETRLFVPVSVGGTTTVTSDSAASYKIQGSVQSSVTANYGIRSAIQSDSTASYAIRASAQNDAASAYSIRGSIQQSSTPAYLIRGLVDQVIAASYAVRGAVSSDASATYNILSATSVSASTSAGYNIRGSINQDTAAIYALRGSVTQDTSATYSILSASSVSASITAGYAIKGSVQSSIVAGYSIAQTVQAEIAASYIIRAGAVSEAQAAYVIRGLVQQSIAASYAIDGGTFSGSISDEDITRIVQAVLAALNATTIPVNIKQVNSITIKGAGVTGNFWGPI